MEAPEEQQQENQSHEEQQENQSHEEQQENQSHEEQEEQEPQASSTTNNCIIILDSDAETNTSSNERRAENSRKRKRNFKSHSRNKRLRNGVAELVDLTNEARLSPLVLPPHHHHPISLLPTPTNPFSPVYYDSYRFPYPMNLLFRPPTLASLSRNIFTEDNDIEDAFGGGYWARRKLQTQSGPICIDDNEPLQTRSRRSNSNQNTRSNTTSLQTNESPSSSQSEQNIAEEENTADGNNQALSDIKMALSKMKCSVCLETLKNITSTTCGHIFCEECILNSIQTSHRCPLCRTHLTQRNIHPLFL